jgi:hypothetical protein
VVGTPPASWYSRLLAGSGKSAIMQSVADFGQEKANLWQASFSIPRRKSVATQSDLSRPLPISSIKELIFKVLWQDRSILDIFFEHKLRKLIVDPLWSLSASDFPRVIVIDGLHECKDAHHVSQLITILLNSVFNPHFPL